MERVRHPLSGFKCTAAETAVTYHISEMIFFLQKEKALHVVSVCGTVRSLTPKTGMRTTARSIFQRGGEEGAFEFWSLCATI